MIITERVFKKNNNIITQPFKVQEENSRISSSGNSIVYSIKETPIRMNMVQENISIRHVEERINLGVQIGIKGDKGDKGDTGENGVLTAYTYTAGEAIGGHRGIAIDNNIAYYLDNTVPGQITKPMGISINASAINENITVIFYGELTEALWNWELDKPIYVSQNGVLTQTCPGSGWIRVMARPITAKKIFVNPEKIVIL